MSISLTYLNPNPKEVDDLPDDEKNNVSYSYCNWHYQPSGIVLELTINKCQITLIPNEIGSFNYFLLRGITNLFNFNSIPSSETHQYELNIKNRDLYAIQLPFERNGYCLILFLLHDKSTNDIEIITRHLNMRDTTKIEQLPCDDLDTGIIISKSDFLKLFLDYLIRFHDDLLNAYPDLCFDEGYLDQAEIMNSMRSKF